MSKTIYLLSGLGFEEEVFSGLKLDKYKPKLIKWVKVQKNMSISDYAKELTEQIKDENPILIGVSFGGIMAVEISKIIKTEKLILISSLKKSNELSSDNVFFNTVSSLLKSGEVSDEKKSFVQLKTPEQKQLVRMFYAMGQRDFLLWAVHAIKNWESEDVPDNLIHIHGSRDSIFPAENISVDYILENSGHFMVLGRGQEIAGIIGDNIII